MHKPIITAKDQIFKTIIKLEQERKHINSLELISILKQLKSIYKNEEVLNALIGSVKLLLNKNVHLKNKLTKRETQVLLLIGQSYSNSDIAIKLNISKSTIETHRKNIRKKLKVNRKTNLNLLALIYTFQHQNFIN